MFERPPFRLRPVWDLVGWAGVAGTVALSVIPFSDAAFGVEGGDKLAHLACYAVLAWWFGQSSQTTWRVVVGLLLLGAGLECVQAWLPWRSASGVDLLADATGIALGVVVSRTRLANLYAALGGTGADRK